MINKFGFLKDKKQEQKITNLLANDPYIKKQQLQCPLIPQLQQPTLHKKQTYLKAQQYHPFQIPPNLHLASIHRKATQFGKVNNQHILQAEQDLLCNCCLQHQKQQLDICCQGKEIYKISQSQGFYFEFIKVIVFALLLLFIVSGIDTIVETERYCKREEANCIKIYSFFHVPQEIAYDEVSDTVLNILSAFFLYPFVIFLFYLKSKIHQRLMSTVIRMEDYSLMVSGFDFNKITDNQIIDKFRPYSVESILFTHKIGDYLPSMQKRFILQAKKNLYFKRGYIDKYDKTVKQIYEIDNRILPFKNTMNIGNERQLRTDKIIIKFRTVEDKQIFIGEFHENLCKRFIHVIQNKSSLEINQIPLYPQNLGEPQEIIWENLQVSSKYKFGVVLMNIAITFGILVVSFIIIIKLTNIENENEQNDELFISFLIAFVIEIFNVALYLTISKMTQIERRITLTGKMMAKIIKNVALFFFNTTLIPFSLFLLDKYSNDKIIIYEYIISLFFVNNLISPLSPILNPFNLYKLYCIRKMKKQGKDCLFTQLQANQMYEKHNFQLELKYQLLSQRILNSCFYAAFFPQVLILTIVGLILDYWIEKWWLLNYCCVPKFSARLGNIINQIALFFPTVYLFGYAANLLMLRGNKIVTFNADLIVIICFIVLSLLISIIFLIFGKKWIQNYLKDHKKTSQIDQSISIKQLDYCDLNPTSFLHIDLQNQLNITRNFRHQQPQHNFQKIQEFVIKRKEKQLKRRDTQRQLRISRLQNLYDSTA